MAFPVRKQKFSYSSVPQDWFDNNTVLSSFWNALSLTFPEGEKFFVASVKHYQNQITNEELKEDIRNFIGQEAAHGKEHRALNKALKEQGFTNIETLEKEVRDILKVANKLPPNVKLAITCALEHFTAMLAEQIILDPYHLQRIDKSIKKLWMWHAIEESEHKHVAFDVYEEVCGSYAIRAFTMFIVSIALGLVVFTFQLRLLGQVYHLFDSDGWNGMYKYFFGEAGLIEALGPQYFEYYVPGFHPNKNDDPTLIKERERLIRRLYA